MYATQQDAPHRNEVILFLCFCLFFCISSLCPLFLGCWYLFSCWLCNWQLAAGISTWIYTEFNWTELLHPSMKIIKLKSVITKINSSSVFVVLRLINAYIKLYIQNFVMKTKLDWNVFRKLTVWESFLGKWFEYIKIYQEEICCYRYKRK
jgi:hypothetical protein